MEFLLKDQVYLILCFFAVLIIVIFAGLLIILKKQKSKNIAIMETIHNLEELNSRLRSQRHDYINQLQVIYGLLELESYEEAYEYLKPIFKDMMKVGKALRTKIPAVNALLMAKIQMAEARNVDLYIEVKSNLEGIGIEGWELCKILSNIIDNALQAVEMNTGSKKVIVDINEDTEQYQICISNNGPQITEEEMKKIFKAGYSTKKDEGHGFGLSIVEEIMRVNHAVIQVKSSEEETTFELNFEKGGR